MKCKLLQEGVGQEGVSQCVCERGGGRGRGRNSYVDVVNQYNIAISKLTPDVLKTAKI